MKSKLLVAAATLAFATPIQAAPVDDAVKTVTTWLDKFNAGDMAAFYGGHSADAVIVDEFAPYVWTGKEAPQAWAKSFDGDSKAHGITEPHMDYAAPLRADSNGKSAYIVVPTVYHMKQGGKAMSASGSMTFVMTHADGSWKISNWTYSAPAPSPDK